MKDDMYSLRMTWGIFPQLTVWAAVEKDTDDLLTLKLSQVQTADRVG